MGCWSAEAIVNEDLAAFAPDIVSLLCEWELSPLELVKPPSELPKALTDRRSNAAIASVTWMRNWQSRGGAGITFSYGPMPVGFVVGYRLDADEILQWKAACSHSESLTSCIDAAPGDFVVPIVAFKPNFFRPIPVDDLLAMLQLHLRNLQPVPERIWALLPIDNSSSQPLPTQEALERAGWENRSFFELPTFAVPNQRHLLMCRRNPPS